MQLAGWVRQAVVHAEDWRAALSRLATDVTTADRALEVAAALELVDPDRRKALATYLFAVHAGAGEAIAPARRLAREVRDHAILADLAALEFETTTDPVQLFAAGASWIDAGSPDRAVDSLARAVQLHNDVEWKSLLAAARRELADPNREVARWVEVASRQRDDAPRLYLHAARVAHAARLDSIYTSLLQTAMTRNLGDELAILYEDRLLATGTVDELVDFYRAQLEAIRDDRAWVDHVRAAATKLVLHGRQPGVALRLLRRGLEHAYRAKVADIPGHIASWELLVGHARESRSTIELMPLVVDALALPIGLDERLYLARAGFEIAVRDGKDAAAARSYAEALVELAPGHPAAIAYLARPVVDPEPAMVPAPQAIAPLPPPIDILAEATPAELAARTKSGNLRAPATPPLPPDAAPRAARVVLPIDLEIFEGERPVPVVARDISASGLFVVTQRELALGSTVTIDAKLPSPGVLVLARHRVLAKVMRRCDIGYGVKFIDPPEALLAAIAALG